MYRWKISNTGGKVNCSRSLVLFLPGLLFLLFKPIILFLLTLFFFILKSNLHEMLALQLSLTCKTFFLHIANQSLSVAVFCLLCFARANAHSYFFTDWIPAISLPIWLQVQAVSETERCWKIGFRIAKIFYADHAVSFLNGIQITEPIKIVYVVDASRKTEIGQNIYSGGSVGSIFFSNITFHTVLKPQ